MPLRRIMATGVLALPFVLVAASYALSDARPAAAPSDQTGASREVRALLATEFTSTVQPLLEKYCFDCHSGDEPMGDVGLDRYTSADSVSRDVETWEKVIQYVRTVAMPPPDADQPTQTERETIVTWARRQLYDYDPNNPDPGRVTIRRLNRVEYGNTVKDLVGIDFDPAEDFPQDDTGYGFDTIGDVLTLPPMLMEKYLAAADDVLDQAIVTDTSRPQFQSRPATKADRNSWTGRRDGSVPLASLEEHYVGLPIPAMADGDYVLRVLASAMPTGGVDGVKRERSIEDNEEERKAKEAAAKVDDPQAVRERNDISDRPVTLSIMLGDVVIDEIQVTQDANNPRLYETRIGAKAGWQHFRAQVMRERGPEADTFIKDGKPGKQQPGVVHVRHIEVTGPFGALRRFSGEQLQTEGNVHRSGEGVLLPSSDSAVYTQFSVPAEREYILRAQAFADQAGNDFATMEFQIDGKPVQSFGVAAPGRIEPSEHYKGLNGWHGRPRPKVYEARVTLRGGLHKFSVRFTNDFYDEKQTNPNLKDRNLTVQYLEIVDPESPIIPPPMPQPLRELFVKHCGSATAGTPDPKYPHDPGKARLIVRDFAERAWRRTVSEGELNRLMALYDIARQQGDSFHGSIKLALKAVLVSPNFLFRGEVQPEPDNPVARHPIGEFELATRLSYFLWSSTPDDELLALAERGELRANIEPQVKRMLASPKSKALIDNFAAQWLGFRGLPGIHPDDKKFPKYDWGLKDLMRRETEAFLAHMIKEDRSLIELLTADYTFVNERLARHYGIEGVKGDELQKVSLGGTPRRGILTHGSILLITSNPTRTSPVKRGKWVLENLLASAPPPPPPDVPSLDQGRRRLTGTVRQQLEKHRESPNCYSCHVVMDPIGFSLENFNVDGTWRTQDGEDPIDSSGQFPDGEQFNGPVELATLLAETRQDDFLACVSEKALTYALGRGVEPYDQPTIDRMVAGLKEKDARFSALILEVVNSVPFQMRRGEAPEVAPAQAQARSE